MAPQKNESKASWTTSEKNAKNREKCHKFHSINHFIHSFTHQSYSQSVSQSGSHGSVSQSLSLKSLTEEEEEVISSTCTSFLEVFLLFFLPGAAGTLLFLRAYWTIFARLIRSAERDFAARVLRPVRSAEFTSLRAYFVTRNGTLFRENSLRALFVARGMTVLHSCKRTWNSSD